MSEPTREIAWFSLDPAAKYRVAGAIAMRARASQEEKRMPDKSLKNESPERVITFYTDVARGRPLAEIAGYGAGEKQKLLELAESALKVRGEPVRLRLATHSETAAQAPGDGHFDDGEDTSFAEPEAAAAQPELSPPASQSAGDVARTGVVADLPAMKAARETVPPPEPASRYEEQPVPPPSYVLSSTRASIIPDTFAIAHHAPPRSDAYGRGREARASSADSVPVPPADTPAERARRGWAETRGGEPAPDAAARTRALIDAALADPRVRETARRVVRAAQGAEDPAARWPQGYTEAHVSDDWEREESYDREIGRSASLAGHPSRPAVAAAPRAPPPAAYSRDSLRGDNYPQGRGIAETRRATLRAEQGCGALVAVGLALVLLSLLSEPAVAKQFGLGSPLAPAAPLAPWLMLTGAALALVVVGVYAMARWAGITNGAAAGAC